MRLILEVWRYRHISTGNINQNTICTNIIISTYMYFIKCCINSRHINWKYKPYIYIYIYIKETFNVCLCHFEHSNYKRWVNWHALATITGTKILYPVMGLLPDTQNCGVRMRRECGERFPLHLQWKPLVSYPGMHHGTCVAQVPWCMSGARENVPGIPGAFANRNFAYLVRGPLINPL